MNFTHFMNCDAQLNVKLKDIFFLKRESERKISPEREGPFFVTSHSIAVNGGGARHSVQVMGTVGKSGHPLTVSLGFLLPVKKQNKKLK